MTDLGRSLGSLDVQIDGQTAESWGGIIGEMGDANIYQTLAYGTVRWGERHLSHLVIRRQGRILAAAQLRIVQMPLIPSGIAYLRWGPMCQIRQEPLDPAVVVAMVSQLRQQYAERRGLALQIIPHAFAGTDRAAVFEAALKESGLHPEPALGDYQTVVVDLEPSEEILRKRLDKKWRNQLNNSEKNGLVLEVSDGPEAYREFLRLYEGMRSRKQFDTTVDVNQFARIHEFPSGAARMQIFLARKDGEAIGALVCSLIGDTAIYLLGATNEKSNDLKAANFLQWQVILWLKERGARWYDLGGIDIETNPGGFHFKTGLGGVESLLLSPHVMAAGAVSRMTLRGFTWLRRRRARHVAPVKATR
jgi:lipid II:glycine glycyltransferase (peptidoglycan interpeptide bridge formation enzyme)